MNDNLQKTIWICGTIMFVTLVICLTIASTYKLMVDAGYDQVFDQTHGSHVWQKPRKGQ